MNIKTMHQLRTLYPEFFAERRKTHRIESPLLKHGYFIMSNFPGGGDIQSEARMYHVFRFDGENIVYIDTRRSRESAIDFIRSKQRINI